MSSRTLPLARLVLYTSSVRQLAGSALKAADSPSVAVLMTTSMGMPTSAVVRSRAASTTTKVVKTCARHLEVVDVEDQGVAHQPHRHQDGHHHAVGQARVVVGGPPGHSRGRAGGGRCRRSFLTEPGNPAGDINPGPELVTAGSPSIVCDPQFSSVQCCLTSTETMRTVRDGEPRTATSTFTQFSELC